MGCCFRAGTFAVQDDCTSGQLNHNTRDTQDRNTAYDGCQLSRVECQGQPAKQAGESSSGARKVAGRTQQWKFFASKRTSRARNQRPASTDASAAACKSSSKGEGSGSTPGSSSSSSSKSRASTASSCMSGCFLRRSHCRTTAPGWEGTSSAASKGTTTPRNKLLSLQSSGSLIPAGFLQPPPTSTVGDGSSSGSPTAAALSHSAPLSSSAPGTTSAAGAKASCAEADAGQKQQGQHSSINTSTALNSSNEGDSSALAPTGLTLVVSSHSSSSLHGSPRCEQGDGPSRSGSSSRASSDSGHTAFASIPSIVHSSASPDSMLSAFSTTSSCFSTNCGGSCCATSMHPAAAATAAVLKAAAAAVNPAAEYSEQQQQQPWLTLQDASSVQQLHLDIDAETHSPSAPQQQHQTVDNQQQEQEHVVPQLQQQQAPASILGVASTAVQQQQQQQPSLGSPYASVGDLIQAASQPERPQQQQQPEFWRSSGWSFSSHSEQNLRSYQEDRTVAIDLTGHSAFQPSERAGLFSVYDGHGGHQVAEFLAEHVKGALLEAGPDTIADAPLSVLGQAVEDAERQLLSSYTDGNSTAAAGSTLCAVLMIDDKLHVAHVGDSRAILARGSAAKQLTRDHKPACAIEAKRIMSDDPDAEITPDGYLYSELAVARAIGSAHLKRDPSRRALIATAETVTVQLQRQDDFVIVATDGLWDTVSNSEAVSVARRVLIDTKDAAAASRALVERAQKCGSSDNISVVTLLLHSRGITVPRSNSRLFKRTPSQQQSFAGASSSADGGSSLPAYTQPSAGASSGADGNSSNNSKATPA